jgi:hypothetical protein
VTPNGRVVVIGPDIGNIVLLRSKWGKFGILFWELLFWELLWLKGFKFGLPENTEFLSPPTGFRIPLFDELLPLPLVLAEGDVVAGKVVFFLSNFGITGTLNCKFNSLIVDVVAKLWGIVITKML